MDLAYDRTGAGEPLVLLHGLGHHRRAWDAIVPRLAAEREVFTLDLPGHGDSPALPDSAQGDYRSLTEVVEKFLRGLGLGRPHVAGNSLGGLMAIDLGARGYARTVTALSPASFWYPAERIWIAGVFRIAATLGARLPDRAIDRLVRSGPARVALFGLFFGRPGRHDPAVLAADLRALGQRRAAINAALKQLKHIQVPPAPPPDVPVTIGWGRRDLVLFPHHARRAQRALPGARVVPLPGLGHVPMNDDPDRVAAFLLEGSRAG
ncbi:MAG: alpha/beta fold hydrolase [Acidimicrobiia bacterium]